MAELTEKEIQKLNREIQKGGLTYTELQQELLDHLCCDVEAEMDEGLEFIKALEKFSECACILRNLQICAYLGGTLEVNHRFITLPIGNYENGPDVLW